MNKIKTSNQAVGQKPIATTHDFFTNIYTARTDFIAALPRQGRLLAIDLGQKRSGLALSDAGRRIAGQFGILQSLAMAGGAGGRSKTNGKATFSQQCHALKNIITSQGVVGMIISLPLNMNGSESKKSQSARQYARNLVKGGITLPLLLLDERLTSRAIDKLLSDDKASGSRWSSAKKNNIRDQMAASYLLQGLLDQMNPLGVYARPL